MNPTMSLICVSLFVPITLLTTHIPSSSPNNRLNPLMNSRNPATQILPPLPGHHKARLDNHIPPLLLRREALNALHQILIAPPIPRHQLPDQRNGPKTPSLIHSLQHRIRHLRELQTRKYAAGLQDAICLPQRRALVGEVPDPECHRVQVDAVVCDAGGAQVLGVREQEGERGAVRPGGGEGAPLAFAQHGGVDVGDCDGRGGRGVDGVGVVEEAEGDVAGAAGYIEELLAGPRVHHVD